jgi:phosphoenolpyruvate carboxylase
VGAAELPRAIGFTASLYSLGIPPELIGTGRGLRVAKNKGKLRLIEKYYLNLKEDILRSGRYLNKKVLEKLAKENKVWNGIIEDVEFLEEYLQEELGPVVSEEKDHQAISEEIYSKFCQNDSTEDLIKQAGVLRKSLG